MTDKLPYTAVTASGRRFDFELPLHPQTTSEDAVAQALTQILAALDRTIKEDSGISEGDVLQALAMALAVRTRLMQGTHGTLDELVRQLVEAALGAEIMDQTRLN